jgi:hypothetical protein
MRFFLFDLHESGICSFCVLAYYWSRNLKARLAETLISSRWRNFQVKGGNYNEGIKAAFAVEF